MKACTKSCSSGRRAEALTGLCGAAASLRLLFQTKSYSWLPDDERFRAVKAKEFETEGLQTLLNDAIPGTLASVFRAIPVLATAAFNAKPKLEGFQSYGIYDQLFRDDDADPANKERKSFDHRFQDWICLGMV